MREKESSLRHLKSLILIPYLESGSYHEVFLFQTQFLAFEEVVIGIQHARNVLGGVTVQNGLDVITIVD